jgi:hypothetical protein
VASAFETIVEFYVKNGNSKAIHESLARRRKLEDDLKSIPNADRHLPLLKELAEEIALLEAGLSRLKGPIDHGPARQDADQTSTKTEVKLVGLQVTASETDLGLPKAEPEVPPSPKQVEVVAVDISGASPKPAVDTASPEGDRPAPVKIVGLTIVDSSTGADHQKIGGDGVGPDSDSSP